MRDVALWSASDWASLQPTHIAVRYEARYNARAARGAQTLAASA